MPNTGSEEILDLRIAAHAHYNGRIRPLRWFVAAIGLVLGVVFWAGILFHGLTTLGVLIGLVLLGYAVFAAFGLTMLLVAGPVEIRLAPESLQLVYPNNRVRVVPLDRGGTTIELSDLSASRALGRSAAGRGVAWLLRVDSGAPVALTPNAFNAVNRHLQLHGARVIYAGAIRGAPGSVVWRYATE